jgi:2-desacetyl-2-hydroxyethyl bacteriochlorophyllide A dehydrogenase
LIAKEIIINGIEDVSLVEREIHPESLQGTECLIETAVSLISPGTELSRVFGLKAGATYPVYPGYCSVGTIQAKGNDLSHVQVGDRVLFSGPHASFEIYDYTKSDGGILFPLDPALSDEEGAFLMMCWIAMNGILPAEVKLGDQVVVFGLGTLGLILSLLYQEMGVDVLAVDPVKERCDLAKTMGVTATLDCPPAEQIDSIMVHTNQQGADIVVDATGLSTCILSSFQVAARNGQVLLLGSPRTPFTTDVTPYLNMIHRKMLTVRGSFNRRYPYQEQEGSRLSITRSLTYLSGLMIQKKIDVSPFISHLLPPEEAMTGYAGLMHQKNKYTGVIIQWKNQGGEEL